MTRTNREALPGWTTMCRPSTPYGSNPANRALEHSPENVCGTLGACILEPPKDIQLSVWFVCWFGVFHWTLHIYLFLVLTIAVNIKSPRYRLSIADECPMRKVLLKNISKKVWSIVNPISSTGWLSLINLLPPGWCQKMASFWQNSRIQILSRENLMEHHGGWLAVTASHD